jgi:hypothetical protein
VGLPLTTKPLSCNKESGFLIHALHANVAQKRNVEAISVIASTWWASDDRVNAGCAEGFALATIGGNGDAEDALNRHRVGTNAIVTEGMAAAGPLTIMELYNMSIVIAAYRYGEVLELHA